MSCMEKDLDRLISKDSFRRARASYRILRANLNWQIHRDVALSVLRQFSDKHPSTGWFVDKGGPSFTAPSGSSSVGESWVGLRMDRRFTGKKHCSAEGVLEKQEEIGVSLVFHFTHTTGLLHVFVQPPSLSDSKTKPSECLLYYSHRLDAVDKKFCLKMIKRMLVLNRVKSAFQISNWIENSLVRYWLFMDARNRRRLLPETNLLFNAWELAILTGGLALGAFIVSLIKD